MDKWLIALVLIAFVVWFYWEDIRPVRVRQTCNGEVEMFVRQADEAARNQPTPQAGHLSDNKVINYADLLHSPRGQQELGRVRDQCLERYGLK